MGTEYIHILMKPSPPSISTMYCLPKHRLFSLNINHHSLLPPTLVNMIQFLSLWICLACKPTSLPSSQSAACLPACLLFFETGSHVGLTGLNSPRSLGWPWISDPPSFTSRVLALQAHAITPDLIQHLGLNSTLPIQESTLPTELQLHPLYNQKF